MTKKKRVYRIELTEEQARVVQKGLEMYFRLMLGQSMDFADEICSIDRDLSPDNSDHDKIFKDYIDCRELVRGYMMEVFRYAFKSPYGVPTEQTEDMLIAQDIWDSIRTARGCNHWGKALILSNEPAPKVKVIEDGD